MKILKKILIAVGVVLVALVLIQAPYLLKQARFISGTLPGPTKNQPTGTPDQLRIPSLDISAPIQYVDEDNEEVYQKALRDGVVHYPGTAEIGQLGNAYIFGHSSDYPFIAGSYKTVFALLPRIEKGAEIIVTDKSGHEFTYIVTDSRVVEKDDLSVLDQMGNKEKLLTLQTSYPVGTALKRYVVLAKMRE